MSTNHYKTLGVDPNASSKDIQMAYRLKARKHHPDAGGDKKKFQLIIHAYEVISDEEKRAAYDRGDPEKSANDLVLQIIQSMIDNAFQRSDPIRFMKEHCEKIRHDNKNQKAENESKAHLLVVKLETFRQANQDSKNEAARDFIADRLAERIEDYRSMAANIETQIQLGTDVIAFLDGLNSPADPHDDRRSVMSFDYKFLFGRTQMQ